MFQMCCLYSHEPVTSGVHSSRRVRPRTAAYFMAGRTHRLEGALARSSPCGHLPLPDTPYLPSYQHFPKQGHQLETKPLRHDGCGRETFPVQPTTLHSVLFYSLVSAISLCALRVSLSPVYSSALPITRLMLSIFSLFFLLRWPEFLMLSASVYSLGCHNG